MTTNNHPITPSPEQIEKWQDKFFETEPFLQLYDDKNLVVLLNQVYQAGADQELEACEKWVASHFDGMMVWSATLRTARRPKPPSPKEEARKLLENLIETRRIVDPEYQALCRALEQLDDN